MTMTMNMNMITTTIMITTITMIMNAKAMVMAFAIYIITMLAAVLMEEIAAVLMSPVGNSLQILNSNLNNQKVKSLKRVLKAMGQNLQRVNHQRVHHLINPFSLNGNGMIGMKIHLGEDKTVVDYQNMQRISIVIWKITMQLVNGMVE